MKAAGIGLQRVTGNGISGSGASSAATVAVLPEAGSDVEINPDDVIEMCRAPAGRRQNVNRSSAIL
jgi:protein subunit release factor A